MSKQTGIRALHQSIELEASSYSRYINELEKKIEEKSASPELGLGLYLTDRPKKVNSEYAEELKRQIEFNQRMKLKERAESQKPAISLSFHGYPNLPQTPMDIRRQREVLRMKQVRQNLTEQLELKKQSLEINKSNEIESAKNRNFIDNQLMVSEKEAKLQKRENQKEVLVNSWGQAVRAKELKNLIDTAERKGITIKTQKLDLGVPLKSMEDESSQYTYEPEHKAASKLEMLKDGIVNPYPTLEDPVKNAGIVEKARKMKEYWDSKEKESYQFKIKQMISEAKKLRQIKKSQPKKSPSPIKTNLIEGKYKNKNVINK